MAEPLSDEEALARIGDAVARFAPVFLELAVAMVHADADVLPQMFGIEAALARAAARFAGLISKAIWFRC
jgi:hypothetical protein